MNRQGVFYLVFFVTVGAVVGSTYLTTKTVVSRKTSEEDRKVIAGLEQRYKALQKRFDSRKSDVALGKVIQLLSLIETDMVRLAQLANPKQSLQQHLKVLAQLRGELDTKIYRRTHSQLKSNQEKIVSLSDKYIPLFTKLDRKLRQQQQAAGKLLKTLGKMNLEADSPALTKIHLIYAGRLVQYSERINSTLVTLSLQFLTLSFDSSAFDQLVKDVDAASTIVDILLTGDAETGVPRIQVKKVRWRLVVARKQLRKLYALATKTLSNYSLASLYPGELKELQSVLSAQRKYLKSIIK